MIIPSPKNPKNLMSEINNFTRSRDRHKSKSPENEYLLFIAYFCWNFVRKNIQLLLDLLYWEFVLLALVQLDDDLLTGTSAKKTVNLYLDFDYDKEINVEYNFFFSCFSSCILEFIYNLSMIFVSVEEREKIKSSWLLQSMISLWKCTTPTT